MTSSSQKAKYKLQLSAVELKLLRSKLQYGDIKRIAFMSNYSIYTVSDFLKGRNNNMEILEAIWKLLGKREETFRRIQEVIGKST